MIERGICISDNAPSCIRAPPEDGTTISAAFSFTAVSAAVTIPSPTAVPIEPPMNEKLNTAITAFCPPTVPDATIIASCSFVL